MIRYLFNRCLVVCLLVCASGLAQASYIQMAPEITVTITDTAVKLKIKISNKGDEDSLVVYPQLSLGTQTVNLDEVPYIPFDTARQWEHEFPLQGLGLDKPGIYPLLMLIHYHDSNRYPLSVPVVTLIHYRLGKAAPDLAGSVKLTNISGDGSAVLKLKNPFTDPVTARIRLFLPNELESDFPEKTLFLDGKQSIKSEYKLTDISAVEGSKYNIHWIVEYDDIAYHHAQVISSVTEVLKKNVWDASRYQVAGGSLFILVLFLITAWVEVRGRNPA